jgi:hypothetical protein
MKKDTLFLLDAHTVVDAGKPRYCPDTALVAGYLSFYPAIASQVEVRTVSPVRPRAAIVDLLGAENQGAPVLVLASGSKLPAPVTALEANGRRFINDPKQILAYLGATVAGAGLPL